MQDLKTLPQMNKEAGDGWRDGGMGAGRPQEGKDGAEVSEKCNFTPRVAAHAAPQSPVKRERRLNPQTFVLGFAPFFSFSFCETRVTCHKIPPTCQSFQFKHAHPGDGFEISVAVLLVLRIIIIMMIKKKAG